MQINIYRLRGVEKELNRLNKNIERFLSFAYNIDPEPSKSNKSGEEAEVSYTNEEDDAFREFQESLKKMDKEL